MKKLVIICLCLFMVGCFFGGKKQEEQPAEPAVGETTPSPNDTTGVATGAEGTTDTSQAGQPVRSEEEVFPGNEITLEEMRDELQSLIEERDELIWQIALLDSAIAGKQLPDESKRQKTKSWKQVMEATGVESDSSEIEELDNLLGIPPEEQPVGTDTTTQAAPDTSGNEPAPLNVVPTEQDTTQKPPE